MAEDPWIVLERLHKDLAAANAEAEAIFAQWRAMQFAHEPPERYYVAQEKALKIARQIAVYRNERKANEPGSVENHVTGTAGAQS